MWHVRKAAPLCQWRQARRASAGPRPTGAAPSALAPHPWQGVLTRSDQRLSPSVLMTPQGHPNRALRLLCPVTQLATPWSPRGVCRRHVLQALGTHSLSFSLGHQESLLPPRGNGHSAESGKVHESQVSLLSSFRFLPAAAGFFCAVLGRCSRLHFNLYSRSPMLIL